MVTVKELEMDRRPDKHNIVTDSRVSVFGVHSADSEASLHESPNSLSEDGFERTII